MADVFQLRMGIRLVSVREMTPDELKAEGWTGRKCMCLEFSDGTILYASRDGEGNAPGELFGRSADGQMFVL